MKPAKFDYYAPDTRDEVLELLEQHGYDAKVLAGGQSLMPMMNLRLARPAVVVDINRVEGLSGIASDDGGMTIGAMTRQRQIERSAEVGEQFPVIAAAVPHIAHFQIRNRGTIGGSLAHSDPAAEIPALCLALDAEVTAASSSGERAIAAGDFSLGLLTTALEPEELLTQVRLPALVGDGHWRWGFREVCRRDGDFALVGAIALLQLDGGNVCREARIAMFGVGEGPVRASEAEASLAGKLVDAEARAEAAALVSAAVEPGSDIHASAEYRKEVSGVMARRALEDACSQLES